MHADRAAGEEFSVSASAGGQLRTVSGGAGLAAALCSGRLARRLGVRRVLLAALALLATGSAASAAAPSFAILAAAQPAIGAGIALVFAAGFAAASDWAGPDHRATALAWTILGQPAAWVVGVPLIGIVAAAGWRWAWGVAPLAASLVSVAAVARHRPGTAVTDQPGGRGAHESARSVRGFPGAGRWAAGELFAYCGWSMVLIYAGTVFAETYDVSGGAIGWLLGTAAAGYFPGTLLARRVLEARARTCESVRAGRLRRGAGLHHAAPRGGGQRSRPVHAHGRRRRSHDGGQRVGDARRAGRARESDGRARRGDQDRRARRRRRQAAVALGGFPALGIASATCLALAAAAHSLPDVIRPERARAFHATASAAA